MQAIEQGIIVCRCCHQIASIEKEGEECSRCHSRLHARYPDSIMRTWSLLITSCLLYIPANVLPIMTVNYLGVAMPSTIMEGVISFINIGDWFVGGVVFIASILVPSMKLLGLTILLIYVQRGHRFSPKVCSLMFHFIEWIGRWSMLDIFVIAVMVALVNFGNLSTIRADWGAIAFASVVILTMLAALSFDPRLIWDRVSNLQIDEEGDHNE